MKKRVLILFLALCMTLSLCACSPRSGTTETDSEMVSTTESEKALESTAQQESKTSTAESSAASTSQKDGEFTYSYHDGVITISGKGALTEKAMAECGAVEEGIKLVDQIEVVLEKGVTEIGDNVFRYCTGMTSVTLPEGVTRIGNNAFEGCRSLESITLPKSLTEIGELAFPNCEVLKNITIPESVNKIGNKAFLGCKKIESITIPEGMTMLGEGVFSDCESLESVILPESITFIGDYAFGGCLLKNVVIPDSVTTIGKGAFSGCPLETIKLPKNLQEIGQVAFFDCENLSGDLVIPDGVTVIGENAFGNCAISSVTFPEGLKEIDDNAFQGCKNLTTVKIPKGVTRVGECAFNNTGIKTAEYSTENTLVASNAFEEDVMINSGSQSGAESPSPVPVSSATEKPSGSETTSPTPVSSSTEKPTESEGVTQEFTDSADFLKLLKEEYEKNKEHTYYSHDSFTPGILVDDTIYFYYDNNYYSYDRGKKEVKIWEWYTNARSNVGSYSSLDYYYLDGQFYFEKVLQGSIFVTGYSPDGQIISSAQLLQNEGLNMYARRILSDGSHFYYYHYNKEGNGEFESCVLSRDLQTVTTIPQPEHEIKHGITEPVRFDYEYRMLAADGTVFTVSDNENYRHLYRLDIESSTWSDLGEVSDEFYRLMLNIGDEVYPQVCGKYYFNDNDHSVYDATSGEKIYTCGENILSINYFGGDTCIIEDSETGEYKLFNLKDGTSAETLKLPEDYNSGRMLNETDFIYRDRYGVFLWNMKTGEEETIMLFE